MFLMLPLVRLLRLHLMLGNLLSELTGSISASQLTTSLANQIDGSGSAVDLANLETFVGYDSTYTGDDENAA